MVNSASIVQEFCKGLNPVGLGKNRVSIIEAKKAIEEAVRKATEEAKKEAADAERALNQAHTNAMNAAKEAHSQAMSMLTGEKELLLQQLAEAQRPLAKRPHIIFGESKVLPNGNIETVKTSALTGGRMTTETLSDGETVISRLVETVNGDKRKTFYDPVTQDPIKTFTNTRGDVLIEYTPNGHKITRVNNKKVKPAKPTRIKIESVPSNYYKTIKETYSDGSYKILNFGRDVEQPFEVLSYNKDDKLVEKMLESTNSQEKGSFKREFTVYNPDTSKPVKYTCENQRIEKGERVITDKTVFVMDEKGSNIKKAITYPNNPERPTRIIMAPKNEYGLYNTENPIIRYKYPKSSLVSSSEVRFIEKFLNPTEKITLKDGTVISTKVNDYYHIYEIKIKPKNGEERIITDSTEIKQYLESIDINLWKEVVDKDHYYNSLI